MAEVASAYVSLLPSAKGFGPKLDREISGDVKAAGKRTGLTFGKVFGVAAALGVGAKAVGFLGDSLAEAREAQKVGALTTQVIKSTGGAANVTAKQVGNLATSISNKVGVDDEAIQSGANLLLTFKNVRNETGKGNDIFNQATKATVDMGAALAAASGGQLNLRSSTTLVGKALNDPIKGLTALSRVGVTFTKGQTDQIKKMVESGQTMQAQKAILKELSSEFGGSAAAQATASDKARVAVGNLKEQIGTALLPVVDKLANFVSQKVVPTISNFITGMQDGTGAGGQFKRALDKLWNAAQTVWSVLKPVIKFLIDNKEATATFASVILVVATAIKVWTTAQLLLNIALTANPIGLIVVAIAALAAGLVLAYKKSDTFRAIVDKAFQVVGSTVLWVWNNVIQPVLQFFVKALAAILETFADLAGAMSHVPGFGWLGPLADKMHGAADATQGLSDSIKKIPNRTVNVNVMVNTSAIAKAEGQLDRFAQHASDSFPHSPVKKGPLTAFNKYGGIGGALMNQLTEGIKDGTPKAEEQMRKMLERLKGRLGSLVDTAKSLAESVASAFTQDAFSGSLSDFFNVAGANVATLGAMQAALGQLKSFGASDAFIKALFSSGNANLINELVAGGAGAVAQANALFGQQQSLSSQLGSDVAQTVLGDEIRGVRQEIKELRKDIKQAGKDNADRFSAAINGASSNVIRIHGGRRVA